MGYLLHIHVYFTHTIVFYLMLKNNYFLSIYTKNSRKVISDDIKEQDRNVNKSEIKLSPW